LEKKNRQILSKKSPHLLPSSPNFLPKSLKMERYWIGYFAQRNNNSKFGNLNKKVAQKGGLLRWIWNNFLEKNFAKSGHTDDKTKNLLKKAVPVSCRVGSDQPVSPHSAASQPVPSVFSEIWVRIKKPVVN
jgi:hypothetical protein